MEILFFLLPLFYATMIILTVTWSIRNAWSRAPLKSPPARSWQLFFEILFTVIGPGLGFWRYDKFGPEVPFAPGHIRIIILLTALSSTCFWIAHNVQPLKGWGKQVVASGIAAGILLCAVTAIHFGPYNLEGLAFPLFGFELLSPFVCIFILWKQLVMLCHADAPGEHFIPGVLDSPAITIGKTGGAELQRQLTMAFAGAVPLILLIALVHFAVGGAPDALVRAFTGSRGFTFSVNPY